MCNEQLIRGVATLTVQRDVIFNYPSFVHFCRILFFISVIVFAVVKRKRSFVNAFVDQALNSSLKKRKHFTLLQFAKKHEYGTLNSFVEVIATL